MNHCRRKGIVGAVARVDRLRGNRALGTPNEVNLFAFNRLLDDPTRRTTKTSVQRQIERMGFVQVDSINVCERAHHHILATRFDGAVASGDEQLLTRLIAGGPKMDSDSDILSMTAGAMEAGGAGVSRGDAGSTGRRALSSVPLAIYRER